MYKKPRQFSGGKHFSSKIEALQQAKLDARISAIAVPILKKYVCAPDGDWCRDKFSLREGGSNSRDLIFHTLRAHHKERHGARRKHEVFEDEFYDINEYYAFRPKSGFKEWEYSDIVAIQHHPGGHPTKTEQPKSHYHVRVVETINGDLEIRTDDDSIPEFGYGTQPERHYWYEENPFEDLWGAASLNNDQTEEEDDDSLVSAPGASGFSKRL